MDCPRCFSSRRLVRSVILVSISLILSPFGSSGRAKPGLGEIAEGLETLEEIRVGFLQHIKSDVVKITKIHHNQVRVGLNFELVMLCNIACGLLCPLIRAGIQAMDGILLVKPISDLAGFQFPFIIQGRICPALYLAGNVP